MFEYRRFPRAPTEAPIQDLTGLRVGDLIVLRPYSQRDSAGRICWVCRCRCGVEVAYPANLLKREGVRSCGSIECRYHK